VDRDVTYSQDTMKYPIPTILLAIAMGIFMVVQTG
jgi:hypothetical protein